MSKVCVAKSLLGHRAASQWKNPDFILFAKFPLPVKKSKPVPNTWFLDPAKTASWSVQPFLHTSRLCPTCSNRPHRRHTLCHSSPQRMHLSAADVGQTLPLGKLLVDTDNGGRWEWARNENMCNRPVFGYRKFVFRGNTVCQSAKQ